MSETYIVRLLSTPMVNTPRMVRLLRDMHRTDSALAVRLLCDGWHLNATVATGILAGTVSTHVDADNAVVFECDDANCFTPATSA